MKARSDYGDVEHHGEFLGFGNVGGKLVLVERDVKSPELSSSTAGGTFNLGTSGTMIATKPPTIRCSVS